MKRINAVLVFGIIFSFSINLCSGKFSDCGSNLATVDSLIVTDCDKDADRCTLHKDSNVTIQIQFTPKQEIAKLNAVVHGIIMDVPIPFPLPNGDGCKDSGVTCPLRSGQSYKYYATLPILKKYPRVSVDVKFELQDSTAADVTCSMIPSKIQ